jgi:hypothetical protein
MSLSGNILSAIGVASQLFAGYGSVTLGPVRFHGLGKPKSMPIGGKQAITTHKIPGGARVMDAMGPDNADIAWSGYLDGLNAGVTARTLDRLRQSGQAITLAWDVFSYQVLVSEFHCETRHIPMPYKITCAVIVDNTQINATALISLALQVTADISEGNPIAILTTASQAILGNAIGMAAAATSAAGATTVGSAAYTAALTAVNNAASAIASANAAASSVLAPIGAALSAVSVSAPILVDTQGMSDQIVTASSACGDLAQLAACNGYLNRAVTNLQRASA